MVLGYDLFLGFLHGFVHSSCWIGCYSGVVFGFRVDLAFFQYYCYIGITSVIWAPYKQLGHNKSSAI